MASSSVRDVFNRAYAKIQAFLFEDSVPQMLRLDPTIDLDSGTANRVKYLRKMMDASCLSGKLNRGLTVCTLGRFLIDAKNKAQGTEWVDSQEDEQLMLECAVAGWVIELMQAHFLVEDDIMDESITRRGAPCWYRRPGVGVANAINDGLILFTWCSAILRHFFPPHESAGSHSRGNKLLELLHETHYRTCMGQFLDVTAACDSSLLDPDVPPPSVCTENASLEQYAVQYGEFNMDHYRRIVRMKTAYYTYHLPLVFGLCVCEHLLHAVVAPPSDGSVLASLEPIVLRYSMLVGEYFQVQDDFLDAFGDPALFQKVGTDIEERKCSWLAVMFLQLTAPGQGKDEAEMADKRLKFFQNYGRKDEHAATVKHLYREAKLAEKFDEYEAATAREVEALLCEATSKCSPLADALGELWLRTFRRKK